MARQHTISREAVKRRLREARSKNFQPSSTDTEFAYKHARGLLDKYRFNRDGTRVDGEDQDPPRQEGRLIDLDGNPYDPDAPLHPRDIWKKRGRRTVHTQSSGQIRHTNRSALVSASQQSDSETSSDESGPIVIQEQGSEPSSRGLKTEQPVDKSTLEKTRPRPGHSSDQRLVRERDHSISEPLSIRKLQDTAEKHDVHIGQLEDDPNRKRSVLAFIDVDGFIQCYTINTNDKGLSFMPTDLHNSVQLSGQDYTWRIDRRGTGIDRVKLWTWLRGDDWYARLWEYVRHRQQEAGARKHKIPFLDSKDQQRNPQLAAMQQQYNKMKEGDFLFADESSGTRDAALQIGQLDDDLDILKTKIHIERVKLEELAQMSAGNVHEKDRVQTAYREVTRAYGIHGGNFLSIQVKDF